ncbi:MAG TPA: hypothetical protein VES67_11150 [Vicinamibacterales bacterium]|nr:hypothetical protein [Vicinamibacterales bacterium]
MTRIGFSGLATAAVMLMLTADVGAQAPKPSSDRQPKPQPATQTAQSPAQGAATSLGSVRLPKAVSANGQALPAGTYTVRLAGEGVPGKVGQTADLSRWCEFVQGGQVKGKELCTVLSSSEVSAVVKDAAPPSGGSKVQVLKGNDYIRVWINRGGTHYLVHLATTA